MPKYNYFESFIDKFNVCLFIIMIVTTLSQVVFRYFLEVPVPWTEELARALFQITSLLGIAFAYKEREHIIVDFLYVKVPPKGKALLNISFAVLILTFLFMWAQGALKLASLNLYSELITISWFKIAYFYYWELFVICMIALYVCADLKEHVLSLNNNKAEA